MDSLTTITDFVFKAGMLIVVALYFVFSTLVYLNVRRLNNFVVVSYFKLSWAINLLYLIHLILVLSLFLLGLVIL